MKNVYRLESYEFISTPNVDKKFLIFSKLDDLRAERAIMEYNLQRNFEKEKSVKFTNDLIAVS